MRGSRRPRPARGGDHHLRDRLRAPRADLAPVVRVAGRPAAGTCAATISSSAREQRSCGSRCRSRAYGTRRAAAHRRQLELGVEREQHRQAVADRRRRADVAAERRRAPGSAARRSRAPRARSGGSSRADQPAGARPRPGRAGADRDRAVRLDRAMPHERRQPPQIEDAGAARGGGWR